MIFLIMYYTTVAFQALAANPVQEPSNLGRIPGQDAGGGKMQNIRNVAFITVSRGHHVF